MLGMLPVTATHIEELTTEDPLLNKILKSLHAGKNNKTKKFNVDMNEFTLHDGILLCRHHRVVTPKPLQKSVLSVLYLGYFVIVKT